MRLPTEACKYFGVVQKWRKDLLPSPFVFAVFTVVAAVALPEYLLYASFASCDWHFNGNGAEFEKQKKRGVSEWEMREENIFNAFLINFLPRQWAKGRKGGVVGGKRQSCHFS